MTRHDHTPHAGRTKAPRGSGAKQRLGQFGATFKRTLSGNLGADAPHGPAGPHHHHGHGHAGENERATAVAALLTGSFMIAEATGGLIANSLTLLADAAHMLTDTVALALAWWAFRQARRPSSPDLSYGRHRMPVLIAFANGILLLLLTAWIVVEAFGRLADPEPVRPIPMLIVAWLGLIINAACFLVLSGGNHKTLNMRGALLHVASDLLGSVAAIIAGGVILVSGWTPIDPILSLVVAALILHTTIRLLREAGHILLEGTPPGISGETIASDLVAHIPGVERVHHVHAWSLSEERLLVTLHAVIDTRTEPPLAAAAIRARLEEEFNVGHATIEFERPGAETFAHQEAWARKDHDHGTGP